MDDSHEGTYFIGRYRVVDEIGVGGMASVHLARMDGAGGFQKWVAIKRIHPHLVENDQFIRMFLDEARIAASISHPNVAQVFDLGSHEDTHWIAMEYLHGEPLREVLRHVMEVGPPMSPPLAARMIADAAEGLHAAHELRGKTGEPLNLVHRDVTPHNLFITYDGVIKVVDFGIAKVTGRLSTTQAGTLKGKIAYMAPEQIRGKAIDRRADIFALGVVLWELTTGRRLFRMDTDLETVERVQDCVVPPPSSVAASDGYDYPTELEAIVMRALRKKPEERYQTARDFSRALQQYIMNAGQFVGPEEISEYTSTLFSDRIRQREAHLKWAAEVTKTLSFNDLRPAILAAGLDEQALRRDVIGEDTSLPDLVDDDDDEADETVVEPFRAALMRQEAMQSSPPEPAKHVPRLGAAPRLGSSPRRAVRPGPSVTPSAPRRVPAPGSTESLTLDNDASGPAPPSVTEQRPPRPPAARVTSLDRDSSTDVSTTRRVLSDDLAAAVAHRPRPPSEPFDEDEEDEDELPTIVRVAPVQMRDRLIVQPRKAAAAAPAVAAQPLAPQPVRAPFSSGSSDHSEPFGPPVSGPNPSHPHLRPPPGVTSMPGVAPQQGPISPSSGSFPQGVQQPPPAQLAPPMQGYPGYGNPYLTTGGNMQPFDAGFDETQWARGLRGSPIIVYAAAAVGGFLIVAVLIAVLLGGPDRTVDTPPAPPPTTTAP